MKTVAIHYGHNCTVAYAEYGKILFLLSEERLVRIKNAVGFPKQALSTLTENYLDGDLSNADLIVVADETGYGFATILAGGFEPKEFINYYRNDRERLLLRAFPSVIEQFVTTIRIWKLKATVILGRLPKLPKCHDIALGIGVSPVKLKTIHHHDAHALSSCFFVPDVRSHLVFTLDAEGDQVSASVSIVEGLNQTLLYRCPHEHSLGYHYAEITGYLGMKPNEHEFKVMGLAPYGSKQFADDIRQRLSELIHVSEDGEFKATRPMTQIGQHLPSILIYERFDNVARALQELTEDLVTRWVDKWVAKTGVRDIAISGGVFMNVKAAKRISELDTLTSLTVVPSAGDESLVLGGIVAGVKALGGGSVTKVETLYLGREITATEIDAALEDEIRKSFQTIVSLDDVKMAKAVAGLLAQGMVIARCVGREEWGARALGNRSILCDPSKFENIERINSMIKVRDFWMPFTPSILEEDIDLYIVNPKRIPNNFMAITFDTTLLARRHLAAAIHPRDFTARPQAVSMLTNSPYHRLITEFKHLTGISALLNTSFNLHGEPNVGGARDGIRTLINSGLDGLILGNRLILKKHVLTVNNS